MSQLALLPDDIMRLIVGFGGMNKHAEEALRAIQRRWRVARDIARRRAAYNIQDAFRGANHIMTPLGYLFELSLGVTKLAAYEGYVGSTAYGLLYVTG